VSEYTHEQAVADGVNVGNEIYEIERTKQCATIKPRRKIERRERLTRRKRWEMPDRDGTYRAAQDRKRASPNPAAAESRRREQLCRSTE
jgi:type I restriction enzyme R subunit